MTGHTWFEILNLAANWFSSIGTVGAVVVALYLARHQTRARLRIQASIVNLLSMGQRVGDAPEYFDISVVNQSYRDVVVSGLQWKVGVVRPRRYVQIPGGPPLSPALPHRLLPGETSHFLFPVAAFLKESLSIYQASLRPLVNKRLRVGIYLSTGEDFLVRPDDSVFKEWLGTKPAVTARS